MLVALLSGIIGIRGPGDRIVAKRARGHSDGASSAASQGRRVAGEGDRSRPAERGAGSNEGLCDEEVFHCH